MLGNRFIYRGCPLASQKAALFRAWLGRVKGKVQKKESNLPSFPKIKRTKFGGSHLEFPFLMEYDRVDHF